MGVSNTTIHQGLRVVLAQRHNATQEKIQHLASPILWGGIVVTNEWNPVVIFFQLMIALLSCSASQWAGNPYHCVEEVCRFQWQQMRSYSLKIYER